MAGKKGGKSAKCGKDREEVLKRGPKKTTKGDLKGIKADLKGSEEEVSYLKKGRLKL